MPRTWPIVLVALVASAALALSGHAAEPAPAPAAKPAPVGTGGLAGLSPEDLAALREAWQVTRDVVADESEEGETRVLAAKAFERINESLASWGTPGLATWYLDVLATTRYARLQEALFLGAQAAARGSAYHLGGVREFWRQVDARSGDAGIAPGSQADRFQKEFVRLTTVFEKQPKIAPKLPPLVLQPVKLNLKAALQPYPEEKKPAK